MARPKRKILSTTIMSNTNSVKQSQKNKSSKKRKAEELPATQNGLASPKRVRKTLIPYQTPESISSILKAVTVTASAISLKEKRTKSALKKHTDGKTKTKNGKPDSFLATPKGRSKSSQVASSSTSKVQLKPKSTKNKKATEKLSKASEIKKKVFQKPSKTKAVSNEKSPLPSPKITKNFSKSKKKSISEKDENDAEKDRPTKSKKKLSKGGSRGLKPKPHVTLYENPTYFSNLPIPHISTIAHSRLVIRAAVQNDIKLLKQFISKDLALISSLCLPQAPCMDENAFTYAYDLGHVDALKLLNSLDWDANKKFGPLPDLMIQPEHTGHGSRMMFGHGLRSVTVGRGGKEGNDALLKDAALYSTHSTLRMPTDYNFLLDRAVQSGCSYDFFEFVTSNKLITESGSWIYLSNNVCNAVRYGNYELAGKVVSLAIKRGGFGYNFLHEQALTLRDNKPFTPFKSVSVVKKCFHDNAKLTPIHFAAINPNPFYLQTLLNSNPEVGLCDGGNWTPIHYAAVCIGDGPLKLLLNRGASTSVINKEGNTPLHLACLTGRFHNVKVLLEAEKIGSNSEIDDETEEEERKPASISVSSMAKLNKTGMRPIHIAVFKGYLDIVEALLDAGDDGNKSTPAQYDKLTPLMIACQQGHLELVEFFVDRGLKLELKDKRGRTAIAHAVINGHTHLVSYLLRLGVNHEAKDSSGNTLIHYAAAYGWYFNIKLLLEAGCDPSLGNLWKMTPLAIAFMKGHTGIVEMLVKLPGVDIDSSIDDSTGEFLLYILF
jgi:ankyrin repeat protein